MKSVPFSLRCLLSALLLACAAPTVSSAQQAGPTPAPSAPPIGTYACPNQTLRPAFPDWTTNSAPLFSLRLETNGTYVAESAIPRHSQGIDGNGNFSYPDVARGTWRWDTQKREFLLEPGNFTFYIKRLPIDPHNPNRLLWGSGFLERQN